jgi:hypothetical protein
VRDSARPHQRRQPRAQRQLVHLDGPRAIAERPLQAQANAAGPLGVGAETGDGRAGFGKGDLYAEPVPRVKLHPPGRHWHAGTVLFEKDWLRRWF